MKPKPHEYPTRPKFVLVRSNDRWEGLYKDGLMVGQDHEISLEDLAKAAGLDMEVKRVDDEWFYNEDGLPYNIQEVLFDAS